MSSALVLFDVKPPAAIITLHRPDKRNALNRQLIRELRAAFERALNDKPVRCVIVAGAGSAFCAGMDLAELAETLDQPNETTLVQEDAERLSELYDFIYRLPKPTIAAVNGPAVAGGAGLVTVCDLALASPEAKFGYPEVRRGLVAAMVMPHLLRHVSERSARDLLLRGELIDAYHAWRIGLINEVVESGEVLTAALTWAQALALSGPQALATTKQYLERFGQGPADRREAARGSADARLTVECKEGLRAFLDKRPAPWAPEN
jgi:methylglutaconyl-CoA hydratase